VTVSPLDLYRLEGLRGEDPELLEDYLGAGRIAFVEWPEAGAGELPDARLRVTLTHAGADRRRIEVRTLTVPSPAPSDTNGAPR
jgi:tRNA A37 threonylcarbamoyladenosine biosynthesis protein TsaE